MEQRKGYLYAHMDIALVWQGVCQRSVDRPRGLALVLVVGVLLTSVLFFRPAPAHAQAQQHETAGSSTPPRCKRAPKMLQVISSSLR